MELPLFPLNTVLFPGATLPLHIFEERYKQMIGECIEEGRPFGVLLIRSGVEAGGPAEPFDVGTTARIEQVERLDDGKMNLLCTGGERFRLLRTLDGAPYMRGEIEFIETPDEHDSEALDLAAETGALFAEYVRLYLALTNQWSRSMALPGDPDALADFIAARMPVEAGVKQALLEEISAKRRLAAEKEMLGEAIRQLTAEVEAARAMRWYGFAVMN